MMCSAYKVNKQGDNIYSLDILLSHFEPVCCSTPVLSSHVATPNCKEAWEMPSSSETRKSAESRLLREGLIPNEGRLKQDAAFVPLGMLSCLAVTRETAADIFCEPEEEGHALRETG